MRPDKEVTISGSAVNAQGVGAVTGTTLTITDDDAAPNAALSLNPSSVSENGGASAVSATLTHPSSEPTTVTVAPVSGAYTVGSDAEIVIAAGETANATDTATVAAVDNAKDEPDRTATVTATLTNSQGAGTVSGATLTLEDDDAAPGVTLALSPSSISESGGVSTVTATLTHPSSAATTVTVTPVSGFYTVGSDAEIVIAAGSTVSATDTAAITAVDNAKDEPDRAGTVTVTVSNDRATADGTTLAVSGGVLTVTDDDDAPNAALSLNPSSVSENGGASAVSATLTHPSSEPTTVTVTPVSGAYTVGSDATIVIAAGETANATDTAAIAGVDNATDEPDWTATVMATLTNSQGAGTVTGATLTLTDDETLPTVTLALSPAAIDESGGVSTVTATLSGTSSEAVTVTVGAAAVAPAVSGDFALSSDETLTIAAGSTTSTGVVTVTANGNAVDAPDKEVTVSGTAAGGNGVAAPSSVTLTITDDDDAPGLSISSPSVDEGDSGSVSLEFTVSLGAASGRQVTVGYADAGTGTATSGTDYTAISAGTLTFAAGETAKTLTVSVTGDTTDEPDETVVVSLSGAANAAISTASGTGTITDDDATPTLSVNSPSVTEGDSGSKDLEFTVTLSAASGQQVTVAYADAGTGTATSGTDYTAITGGTLTFTAGTTSQTFNVSVTGDVLAESNETVVVTLSNAGNATISTGTGTGTITDNDAAPTAITLTVDDGSVGEGDGATTITVTATVDGATRFGAATTVTVSVAGSGTAGAVDFAAVADFDIEIAAGAASQTGTFTLTPTDDTADETDETITVSGASGGLTVNPATITLTDDDATPTLSVNSPSVAEGDSGTTNLTFTVTLSEASGQQVTVGYADATTGTATSGTDYEAITGGTLTFAAGTTSRTFDVSVTGDALDEANETVVVTLSGETNATIATATGTGMITDDDDAPTLSIDSPSVTEGDSGSTDLTFTVTLSAASGQEVTVAYADAGTGTATSGTDYTAITGGTLTFAAGTTSQTFNVSVTGDVLDESNETVVVELSSSTNAAVSNTAGTGTGTITDDDATPTLSVNSPSVTEGDSGTTDLTFTVTLSAASGQQVTVGYADATTGTATSGTDYTAITGGTLTFAAGTTSQTFDVSVLGDALDESNETVVVSLSNAGNATIATASGTGTITDDDGAPTLSVNSPSVTEGDSGSKDLTFTVTLSAASGQQVTVAYADATTGTATSGTDYTAITGGTLTFTAGTTSQTFDVSVLGDVLDESNETVVVSLSSPTNAAISNTAGTGTGTITDDDDAPTLSMDSPSVTEGDSGTTNLTFTVTLSAASGQQVTVAYADAGSGTATSGTDYTAITGGTLTFTAGTTSQTFDVSVTGDTLDESNETVVVELSSPTNAAVSNTTGTGTGTITDDDDAPTLSITSPSVAEGDSSSKDLTFTVTLSAASGQQVTVGYADATTGTATSGTDYTAITGGTLTFTAGTTSRTFDVSVTGDTLDEANETVVVTLSGATNATISTTTGTGTITDDDDAPTLSMDSPSVTEGDSGTTNLTFTVTLSAASGQQVTVAYADAGTGTATSGTDYTAITGGTLTFAAGTTSRTFNVSVTGDTLDEANETVVVTLSSPTNAAISNTAGTGTGTITDDDDAPTLSIASPSVTEGDSGTTNLTFTVTLSAASGQQVTVAYADAGSGTATSGTDYTAITGGTLTFTAGTTSQTFDVSVTGDTLDEANEMVVVTLSGATNAAVSNTAGTGTGTITDDDDAPTLSIASPSVAEGDSGSKDLTFTVTLSAASGQQVTVDYADAGSGTATSGTDYTAITGGTLTFAAGTTSQTFDVSVTGDVLDESNETVVVELSNAGNATIATASGTGTITDNDATPTLSVNSPSVTEGDSGTTDLTFTVTLSAASGQQVTVAWAEGTGGTATSGTDYTAITGGTLTFAAGTTSQTFDVAVLGDALDEANETVVVTLSGETNATIATASGTGTITDNDATPTLSVNSPSVTEGDSGTTDLTFTVTLSAASGQQVTVAWAEGTGGTATSGTDYTAITGGTLTFAAGTTSQTFDVAVLGDALDEANETVVVTLSGETNATIATASGTGTITDDDATPSITLTVDDSSVGEGDGATTITVTATVDGTTRFGAATTVTVSVAGSGAATAVDFAAVADFDIEIAAGAASQTGTFTLTPTDDTEDETDETITVSGASGGLTVNPATISLTDDDGAPTLSVNSPSVTEGDSGTTDLTFTVTLSAASGQQVTVAYADATTGTATSGTDYEAITGGTLTFAAGTTSRTFDVSVTGDVLDESNETVVVSLSSPTNAAVSSEAGTGTGTITDDDATPSITLTVDDGSVGEGDGATTITVTATVDGATRFGAATTVTVSVAGSGTASAVDFAAVDAFDIEIAAGAASQTGTFTLTPTDDTADETDETITVSGASGSLTVNPATISLTDDDDAPTLSVNSPSVTEGDSGTTNLTFTVTLSAASGRQVTVAWAEGTGGTATSGTDYTAITGGTLTFAAGTTSQAFDVSVMGDTLDESNETVVVELSNAGNATIATASGTGTITDDDATPSITLTVDDSSVGEDDGATTITVTATVDGTTRFGAATTVTVSVAGSGAATAVDFAAVDAFDIEIAAGAASETGTFTLTPTDDTEDETDETITVSGASGGLTVNPATISLTDDDDAPTLSMDSPSVTEGDSGTTNLTFTVTLSAASGQQVTVAYADAGTGTATSGTDYTAITGGTLTFAAGTTSRTFNVSVTGDVLDESNETVVVSLSSPTNATVSNTAGTGTGTITDDDATPSITLTVDDSSVGEGDGATTITVTATVDGTTRFGAATTVTVSVAGSGAATAVDFAAVADFDIEIAAGAASQTGTFTLTPTDDTTDETDETITVSGASGSLTVNPATISLTDDDGAPTLSVNSPSVTEGDSGSKDLTFTVTLSAASVRQVTVAYADAGTGTATSGTDYTAITGGTLTFTAGTTSQTFDVSVTGDALDEANETVVVTLSNAANATISTATGTGTITDNDATPTLSINSPSVTEGDSGTATLTFTVTLSAASGRQVTVAYADAGTGTATSGTDYEAITGGALTFTAGTTSRTFNVSVTGDVLDESNETVVVSLSSPTNAAVSNTAGTGTGTITDDDATPSITLTVDDSSVGEGDGATTITVTATVDGTTRFGAATTVTVSVAGSGAATAVDFAAVADFDIEIAAGAASQTGTFTLTPTDDMTDETDETITVSGASGGLTVNPATISLTDDDGAPTLSVNSPSVTEGDSGTTNLTFTVTLSAASGQQVTVGYADATTGTATSGTDYTAITGGTLTFAAGTTSRTFNVSVLGDTLDEANETVVATLSGATNAAISNTMGTGTGTITDDDATPSITLTVDDSSVGEGDGATTITVTATVDGTTRFGAATTVTVSVAGSGAAAAVDFAAVADFDIEIAAGAASQTGTFTLTPTDDTTDETDETIMVSGASGSLTVNPATISLTDDDGAPTLSIDSPSVTEGDSGSKSLTFTVTLSPASGQEVTVDWAEGTGGTATSGTDYTAITGGTLTFTAGTTSQTFDVSVLGDVLDESNETVVVSLSSPTNAAVSNTAGTGTGTITDDDDAPTVSIDSPSVTEGDSGTTSLTFTVTLSAASGREVTVAYADASTDNDPNTVSGTATSGTDYEAIAGGTLTFAAGTTSQTFDVSVTGDTLAESNETVVVTLSGPAHAVLGTASGTGTITDDDVTPAMGGLSADAGDGQTVVEGVVVTLDGSRSTGPSGRTGLGYAWTQSAGGPVVALAGADTARPSFTAPQVAATTTLTFTLTVTAGGVSASDTVHVTVTDEPPRRVDSTPSFEDAAIADKRWKQSTAVTAFTLPTASGGDGALVYALSPQLPEGLAFDADTRMVTGTPVEVMAETEYTWTATDADGDEATLAFSITVVEDLIPEFTETVSDQLYWVGAAIDALELPAASGGDGALAYTLLPQLPEGLAFDADTRMVTGTPVEVMAEKVYTLTATDADGDTAMLSFRVEVAMPVKMSMEGAQAEEGEAVAFTVELSPPPPRPMEVLCVVMPGTATIHEDYVHLEEHRLSIAAGQHSVRVVVATIDDEKVEPEETFTVSLVPEWTVVERVEATGTILDNDAAAARARALKVMLASFGREVAQEAVEVVGERLGEGASGSHVTLAGQRMVLGPVSAAVGEEAPSGGFDREALHRREVDKGRSVSAREIVSDSAFAVSFGAPEEAGSDARDRWTVWGRTGWSEFSGRSEGELSAQGKVLSGYVGLDARVRDDLVLGVALSHSEGDMSYERSGAGGEVDARLTSVLPYGRWTAGGGLSVWGLLSAGWGEVELVDDLGATRTGIGLGLLALGWRQELEAWQEVEWALRGDGFMVEVDSEAAWMLPATRAGVQRLRLMLEGGREWSVAEHGRLRTKVELGGRWDGGDAQRGYGSEVGGSLEYVDSRLGVGIEGRGRYVLGHESQGFRTWGASLGVRVDPGGDGEGMWIGLSPVWGAPHSGVQSLWEGGPQGGGSKESSSVRMALEAGYRSGDALDVRVTVDQERAGGASSPVGVTLRTRLRW